MTVSQRLLIGSLLAALVLDQVTKFFASRYIPVTLNLGISFGLVPSAYLTIGLILFFIAFFFWSCRRWQQHYPVLVGVLLGAALSNLIDRLILGGVRDFLPLPFLHLTNNLADWMIVIPLGIILFKENTQQQK